jgi:hypothetical protein
MRIRNDKGLDVFCRLFDQGQAQFVTASVIIGPVDEAGR